MKKITKIKFINYRAFYGDSFCLETSGKNVLIYGENGSGKTSLFRGLKSFFEASNPHHELSLHDESNLFAEEFNEAKTLNEIGIHLHFDEEILQWNNLDKTPVGSFVAKTHLLNSFFSYKELLQTHYRSHDRSFVEDFTKLLLETLLRHHQNPFTQNSLFDDYANMHMNINQMAMSSVELFPNQKKLLRDAVKKEYIMPFVDGLTELLQQINKILSEFLANFQQHFTVILQPEIDVEYLLEHRGEISIHLIINYMGIDNYKFLDMGGTQHFFDHLDILNEARLSALAISIYLAALKTYPSELEYKILFLDDIFIGLDNANRLPLLKILNQHFSDYQIFLTTYDRYWFEVAKEYLDEKDWTTAELYINRIKDESGKVIREDPFLKPNLGNVQRALFYADTLHDYPAAGNYLRKECERLLKKHLPNHYRIAVDGSEINTLEALTNQLEKYFEDYKIKLGKEAIGVSLRVFKKAILNPTSHDDLRSPLYRSELDKAFDLVKQLEALPKLKHQTVALKGDYLRLNLSEYDYWLDVELTTDLKLVQYGDHLFYTDFKVICRRFQKGAEPAQIVKDDKERALKEIVNGAFKSLGKEKAIPPNFNMQEVLCFSNGESLVMRQLRLSKNGA
jgi:energy-coupling factor transporter ATP-binding protein EcfA2